LACTSTFLKVAKSSTFDNSGDFFSNLVQIDRITASILQMFKHKCLRSSS